MAKRKILVTGGAGYIGAHAIIEIAEAGCEPIIIDDLSRSDDTLLKGLGKILKYKPTFYKGSCLDRELVDSIFREQGISSVMHFAAYKSVGESVKLPLAYYSNNLNSLMVVMDVMKSHGIKDIIFSSSCTVYGEPDKLPVAEDAPIKPAESPYGATKQMCERILQDAYVTGYRVVALRYFNPVGAHPSIEIGELPIGVPNNLVPYITQTAAGKRDILTVFGDDYDTPDGSCIRDYIHVSDVASAHVRAMEYLDTKGDESCYFVFNLGTGNGSSVLELIRVFEEATGVKLRFTIGPRRPGDVEKTYADPSKAFRELKWRPRFSIKDALSQAWQWQQKMDNSKKV